MSRLPGQPSVSGDIRGASGQTAIGTNIRQNAVFLTVQVSPGDPAALDRVAQQIRLSPIAERLTAWGRDFPGLIGREGAVSAVRIALDDHESVATFGDEGIGKSVLLRHVARRTGSSFTRGVALIPTGGMLWQDICQEIIRAFFRAEVPIHLGPSQVRTVLGDLDALLLLDDVDPGAGLDQLFALVENASFVVASTERVLAGESRAVHLEGLDEAGVVALIRATLVKLGAPVDAELDAAARIGVALGGHPGRIIRVVEDAYERHVDLPGLAAELAAGVDQASAASLGRLGVSEQAVVDAVDALDGAPIGPEHVAAVVPAASIETVNELKRRRILRAASPQVRLDPDIAKAHPASGDPDEIRARLVDHFVAWAGAGTEAAESVADESRAILYLLDWAERTGRVDAAWALSTATEGAFALANRWGAWAQVTVFRLRAAEQLGLDADVAVALNQIAVQALGQDAPLLARGTFVEARDRAVEAGAPAIAAIAGRNLEIIDGFLAPPPKDGPPRHEPPSGGDDGDGITRPWPRSIPRSFFILGVAGLLAVTAFVFFSLIARRGLAIEPAAHVFQVASVGADGEQVAFMITNRGTATLDGLDVGMSGDAAGEFFIVGGDCPGASLPAGRSCSVALLFHPNRAGDGQALLTVTSRDGTVVSAAIQSRASEPTASPTESPSTVPSPSESSSPPPGQPDLVIASFALIDVPERGDYWRVPVEVVIVNAGNGEAGPFPIVITADGEPVPFDVPGEDPVDLVTRAPLGPNEKFSYAGTVRLPLDTRLERVRIVVGADSCARKPSAPPHCSVVEPNERNNSYPLQVVDLQLANLKVGEPQEPIGIFGFQPPWVNVPVAFDIRNAGTQTASEFWIAAFLGQFRPTLQVKDLELDPSRNLPHVPGLEAGGVLHLEGVVTVPRTYLGSPLLIAAGCPPSAEPCQLPEIALPNNVIWAPIPPTPTPTPTYVPR